jgi:hypothetical protein
MPYNLNIDISSTISLQVVKEMVVAEVERSTGRKVREIIEVVTDGNFNGYQVIFDTTTPVKKPFVASKEFIPMTYN